MNPHLLAKNVFIIICFNILTTRYRYNGLASQMMMPLVELPTSVLKFYRCCLVTTPTKITPLYKAIRHLKSMVLDLWVNFLQDWDVFILSCDTYDTFIEQ
jgi:hypothetical protein